MRAVEIAESASVFRLHEVEVAERHVQRTEGGTHHAIGSGERIRDQNGGALAVTAIEPADVFSWGVFLFIELDFCVFTGTLYHCHGGHMKHTNSLKRLNAVMQDINGDNTQILRTLQDQIDYLQEKVGILEEIIEAETGKEQPVFSEDQKRRLAHRGRKLNKYLLSVVEQTYAPGTIHDWYRELVGKKYDSTGEGQRKRGRNQQRRRSSKRFCSFRRGIQIGATTASPGR